MRGTLRAVFLMLSLGAGPVAAEPVRLDVISSDVYRNDYFEGPHLALRLSSASTVAFADYTRHRVGCLIDLWIDGRLVVTANVIEPITRGLLSLPIYDHDVHALSNAITRDRVSVVVNDPVNEPGCIGGQQLVPETP